MKNGNYVRNINKECSTVSVVGNMLCYRLENKIENKLHKSENFMQI